MMKSLKKFKGIKQSTLIAVVFGLFSLYVAVDSAGIQIPVWLLVIIALGVGALVRMQSGD